MVDIIRTPDSIDIICEEQENKASVDFKIEENKIHFFLKANGSRPKMIKVRWNYETKEKVSVLGDAWERAYGDLEWRSLSGERFLPWYFLASNGTQTVGCGAMVGPNSFICFQYDAKGVLAWFDVRNGGRGVNLGERELLMGTIVCEHYSEISEFEAAKVFCKVMSPSPRIPKFPVYGSNNWYYAYGNSSYEEIVNDSKIIAKLTEGLENRPFMVIDDGWSEYACAGPWNPNKKFGDMKALAEDMKNTGVKPGIWIRPLHDDIALAEHPEWGYKVGKNETVEKFLDPTHPQVKEYLKDVLYRIKGWGYELLKHDFTTYDLFGNFGFSMTGTVTADLDWDFYDDTKTNAEIALDLYNLIRDAVGDMIIIGCNTISHLSAGIFEVNRIGDDTSGRYWNRTRIMGVNSLAFRLPQNDAFYKIDADCVGMIPDNIDWKLNRQWLDLLAKSGSPLFVSIHPQSLSEQVKADLKEAFRINSIQQNVAEPTDWMYNVTPSNWNIDGKEEKYDFFDSDSVDPRIRDRFPY